MFKDNLAKTQPVAYRMMNNVFVESKLAHAYIFTGPNPSYLKDAAIYFAQSLVCEEDEMACEICNSCRRVKEQIYSDFIFIDGTTTSIKKQDIVKLQEKFSKSSIEHRGRKIYIIHHAENASDSAMNSLLKFLEEPTEEIYAILTVEQADRMLPTILSRCQLIQFKSQTMMDCYDELKKQELEEWDAYVLAQITRSVSHALELVECDEYQHARYVFKEYMKLIFQQFDLATLLLQKELSSKKRDNKQTFMLFLDMFYYLVQDSICHKSECKDESWNYMMKEVQKHIIKKEILSEVLLTSKDKLLKIVNVALLIDQFSNRLKEGIQ